MTTIRSCVLVLGMFAAPAAAQVSEPLPSPVSPTEVTPPATTPLPTTPAGRDIVVVGNRIPDYKKQLDQCLARRCSPHKDIAITLDLAQAQFEAGNYQDARTTLLAARHRNARFANAYPVAVANLHHANSLIAGHLGLADSEWSSALDTVSAMKAGMPETDPRVFLERIELGDAYATAGKFDESQVQYRSVARRAHKLGLDEIEALALLRIGSLNTNLAEAEYASYAGIARTAIDTVLKVRDPKLKLYVDQARNLRTQLAILKARGDELDRLIAHHPTVPAGSPAVLLYAPKLALSPTGIQEDPLDDRWQPPGQKLVTSVPIAMSDFAGQWIDVVFTVGTDGRVQNAQVARHGAKVETTGNWAGAIVAAIAGRRYAHQAEPSTARERFTFTSNWRSVTGSRLPQRDPTPRLVRAILDSDPS